MALVEEYFELNEAEEVSIMWKTTQIITYIFAACLGLWCGYTMALLRQKFDDKCYLFTTVKFQKEDDTYNVNWTNDSLCDFCQYSMVSSFIVATIWATFFLMCGKGGKSLTGLPQPWRIVWPSLIFNFLYFIVILTTALNIQQGTDYFCLHRDFHKLLKTMSLIDSCKPLEFLLKKDLHVASLQLDVVAKTSWGCAASWFILIFIPFFRIIFVIDFDLYKICVFKMDENINNKKEEVLKITNYEEPRKLHFQEDHNKKMFLGDPDKFENIDERKKKKMKTEKKLNQPPFNSPIQPNAAFYVDLRMLNRDKKRKYATSLDQAFEANKSTVGSDMRNTIKIHSKADDSRYPHMMYGTYYGNSEAGTSSRAQEPESFFESEPSGSEVVSSNFENDHSVRLKKYI